MKETDLYQPVKELLMDLGYTVRGEVKDIDIVALKDEHMIIVELKTSFTLKLILQAVKRQRLSNHVYIAIPRPQFKRAFGKDFNDKKLLLRRLELGLIFVSFDSEVPYAQVVFDPKPFSTKLSQSHYKKQRIALCEEIALRSGDYNAGGTKGKIITSYREKSLYIASLLEEHGALSTKILREYGADKNCARILYDNHYNWFEKVKRSVYGLSEEGINDIDNYRHIIERLLKTVPHKKN